MSNFIFKMRVSSDISNFSFESQMFSGDILGGERAGKIARVSSVGKKALCSLGVAWVSHFGYLSMSL